MAADFKMSDQMEPESATATAEEQGQEAARSSRVRTVSEVSITEELEKRLLAEEDEDLDVIECFVDDFDSEEDDCRRKEADKVEQEKKVENTVEVLEVVRIVHSAEEDEPEDPLEGFEDVLQIDEGGVEVVAPRASVHVSGDERMLDKPLVKQIVMEVAGDGTDCGDDDSKDCNGGEKSPERDVSRAPTPVETQEDSDGEQPLVIADSVEANVGGTQEDPDVLQLKLDLYQSMGDMDYEPDDDEHRDSAKDNRTDDCGEEKLERRFTIKEEPMSPVEDRLAKIQLALEDIPTIELSSDYDYVEVVQQPKKSKKKSKKKAKKRNKSECSLDEAVIVQDPLPAVMSTTSSKTILSCDSMYMDEELLKTGFRMELRKRKSATLLEETGSTPLTRQRRNPRKSVDSSTSTSVSQSKSKASVVSTASSSGLVEDKPAKRPKEKKSAFQPVSTEYKLKINSLFADCEKRTVQPDIELASILDDDKPLLDRAADPFEERSHKRLQPRQTKIIEALPRVGPPSSKSKWNEHAAVATSPLTQKPKVVPEIIESLEKDLAMSSSDEDVPLEKFCAAGGKGASTEKAMKPGRKRGRPQLKQNIEDYFGPTSEDQAECDQPPVTEPPTVTNGGAKKPSSKRRKKRLRINSNSSDDNDDATTMESVSLAGTNSSTTATVCSNDPVDPELAQLVEQPKTDEMRVVLSPLTDEKIEKLRSKCNTPKKGRALSKASQTEVQGLSWKIQLNQIDFFSEYFVNLYDLITNGRRWKNFEGVVIAGRGVVSPEVAPQCPQPANGHARSDVQQLLFRRAIDEVDLVSPMRIDPVARERSERNMRTNFRIPKLGKQPSRSPQDVTSSTQHDLDCKEEKPKPPTVVGGGGYSNDQLVVAPRRNVAAENGNNLFANRPEDEPRNDASRAMSFRRTIRNDNVQQQPLMVPAAQQQPPVDSGFPSYGVPEQAPPPPPQYRATCSGSNTFGGYLAPNQEVVDVKPNFSALAGQAALMGAPGMMNSSRYLDLLTMLLLREQLTMQEQQQQNRFPPMINNAQYGGGAGQMMLAAMMAHNQQPLPPEPAPTVASTGRRFAREPLPEVQSGQPIQPNENSEHISQLLGCYDHLMGRCIKNPCQFSHTLPTESSLFQNLMNSAQDVVMATYAFVKARENLFQRYFVVYAEVMGRRNLRHQLVDTVPDCEKSKRTFSYYRYVVDGLTVNGTLSRARAVQFVLEKHTKVNFDQINVLVSLIIDTADEIPQFLQWLEEFSRVQNYQFEVASINRLVEFCVRASNSVLHSTVVDVAKLTYRLLLGVATGKEPRVNPGHLLEFVQLLMKSNVGLDVEEIVSKYRANEMSDRR